MNEHLAGYTATSSKSWSSTDRKIGRLRWPGKGRRGVRLEVKRNDDHAIVFTHDSSQTYRHNGEAVEKIAELAGDGQPHRYWWRWFDRRRADTRAE